jgi:gliding motility-associated-like protein
MLIRFLPKLLVAIILLFSEQTIAQNFVFARLDGVPVNTAGWNLIGDAAVSNTSTNPANSEIVLCRTQTFRSGAIFYNQPINLGVCNKWKAEFDFRMFDGTGADGLAFCFLDVPPTGFVSGGGLGIPGTANGLKVCFDTYQNCGTTVPKIQIRWGAGYAGECVSQPTLDNTNGALSFIRSNSFNRARVEYDNGTISVFVNNTLYLTGFQQFNFNGYLGFTASTGGFFDNHSIKNVIIYTEMPPGEAGTNVTVCPKETIQIGTANDPNYVYSWSPNSGLSNTNISNPVFTGLDNFTNSPLSVKYYVQTSFASNPGCGSRDSVTVTVNVKPRVDFTTSAVCSPANSVTYNSTTTIGDNTSNQFQYLWSFGDGNTATTSNPTNIFPNNNAYNVKLEVTSGAGCKADTTKSVQPISKPTAQFTAPIEACTNTPVSFTNTSPGTNLTQWSWIFGDGGNSTQQNPIYTFINSGTYTVKLVVTNSFNCTSDTFPKTIVINPLPVADFTTDNVRCLNRSFNFQDISTAANGNITQWNWNFGNGNTATIQNPTTTYNSLIGNTTYLIVTDSKGCLSDTTFKSITTNPIPQVSFAMPTICAGESGLFTNNSTISDGTAGQFVYLWSFGNGSTSTQQNPTQLFSNSGNFIVALQVTSVAGCIDSSVQNFVVSDVANIVLNANSKNICSNLQVQLTNQSTISSGTINKLQVYWNWPDATDFIEDNNPTTGKQYTKQYTTFGAPLTKQVILKYVAFSGTNCSVEKFDTIQLRAVPRLVFSPIPDVCINASNIQITQASDTSALTGIGTYLGLGVLPNGNFLPNIAGINTQTIAYVFVGNNGCFDTIRNTISVRPIPLINAGPDIFVLENGSQIINLSVNGGGTNFDFLWSPPIYLDNAFAQKPKVSPKADQLYNVFVSNEFGCEATDDILVQMLKAPVIPNAFSPNKDGINEVWNINYLNSYPGCTVDIFNRQGQPVFRSVGYSIPWDGTRNGKILPVGVYYYLIDTKTGTKPLSGFVALMR